MDLLVPQPRPKESNREYACRVLRMNIMTFRKIVIKVALDTCL